MYAIAAYSDDPRVYLQSTSNEHNFLNIVTKWWSSIMALTHRILFVYLLVLVSLLVRLDAL